MPRLSPSLALALVLVFGLTAAAGASAADRLVASLKGGGYVLVMRHAHSPSAPPPPSAADPGNARDERQLDAEGESQAEAIGEGLKTDGVPIGPVYASPTSRAVQTVRLMGLKAFETRPELGDGGASMAAGASGAAGTAWLRAKAAETPPKGTDAMIVTHGPNITLAFGDRLKDLGDGEAAVFRPDGKGGAVLVGRIRPGDWKP